MSHQTSFPFSSTSDRPLTFEQWQAMYSTLRTRADRLSAQIVNEARKTARAAGLDPGMPFLHAHNALCALHYGKPWPEVDYSLARKVLWLEQRSFEPGRLVDQISSRVWKRVAR